MYFIWLFLKIDDLATETKLVWVLIFFARTYRFSPLLFFIFRYQANRLLRLEFYDTSKFVLLTKQNVSRKEMTKRISKFYSSIILFLSLFELVSVIVYLPIETQRNKMKKIFPKNGQKKLTCHSSIFFTWVIYNVDLKRVQSLIDCSHNVIVNLQHNKADTE